MEFSEKMQYYAALTEPMLRVQLDQFEAPSVLYDSMAYSLFAGGKRLRPMLCLAACEMCGGMPADALKAACALEMIHTYSLIHDDLPAMDDDDLRRGKPSNHKVFGEGNAILAGDGLLSLAMHLAAQTANAKVMQAITRGAMDMVSGQSMDLNSKCDAETLFKMHEKKTGALILASVLAGAHTAGVGAKEVAALTDFSMQYGLLFQITDDILDVTGTQEEMGKSIGKDSRDEKVTFVSVYGLDAAREQAKHAADAALKALDEFEGDSTFFRALIETTLDRKH
ncbi:MAG: polyprenyl synthetase family protein [Clostridia bacterium]|nr:polyprenyl synthetase family protein [Clostridia bacterium]